MSQNKHLDNLPRQNELFFELLKKSANGVFIADTHWTIYDIDEAFKNVFLKANSLSDSLKLESLFAYPEAFSTIQKELKRKAFLKNVEVELMNKRGKRIHCELSLISHRAQQNTVTVYLGMINDITKRKQAENDLLQAEKLIAAGNLSRVLAHEVRNPLTNVQLALEQLKDEFPEQADDAELYFDVIDRNTKRIGNLITQLLQSSRPRVLNRSKQPINPIIESALGLVKDRLTLKNIALKLRLSKANPAANVDADQLKLALVNVMVNAIEAMKEDRGILTISSKKHRDGVSLVVKDNGHGLTPEEINKLFEAFYSKKRNGTGLGLTTVQNIIHSHQGKINVQSTLGLQTEFTIWLPA